MRVEILLGAGEEYPSVFTVYRDDGHGYADLATRRNYVDGEKGWDVWRETREDLAKALNENAKLRKLVEGQLLCSTSSPQAEGPKCPLTRCPLSDGGNCVKPELMHELGFKE